MSVVTQQTPAEALTAGRRSVVDDVFRWALFGCLAVGIAFLVVLVTSIVVKGYSRLNWDLIANMPSRRPSQAGIQSALTGSLWTIVLVAVFIVPVGVAAAVYLEEYADNTTRFNRMIELNIQNLAAVPSIIYGILALGVIARGFLGFGESILTGAIALGLLVLPVVIISGREAIRAVPGSIRAGSLALGASKWQTTWRMVLPNALPGMATGTILALSRAIGEAAPLILLGGLSYITFNPEGVFSSFTVLPIQIFNYTSRPQEEFRTLASAASIVLLVLLLVMNSAAILLRNRYARRR